MLKHVVGKDGEPGQDVVMTPDEEAAILAEWAVWDNQPPPPAPSLSLADRLAAAEEKIARADAIEAAAIKAGVLTKEQIDAEDTKAAEGIKP